MSLCAMAFHPHTPPGTFGGKRLDGTEHAGPALLGPQGAFAAHSRQPADRGDLTLLPPGATAPSPPLSRGRREPTTIGLPHIPRHRPPSSTEQGAGAWTVVSQTQTSVFQSLVGHA